MTDLSVSFILGLVAVLTSVSAPPQPQTSTLRGVVLDSLTMRPLAGAVVWVSGGTQIAKTDSSGRFELSGVERGKRFIEFSAASIDSLGLGNLGAQFDITKVVEPSLSLATPSFETVWRKLCGNSSVSGADSGIVWGSAKNATTNGRLHGARVDVGWTEPRVVSGKRVELSDVSRTALSDSTGTYALCGVPGETNLSLQAAGAKALSGALQLNLANRKIVRLDLLVSTDMVPAAPTDSSATSVAAFKPRGSSNFRGVVLDANRRPVSEATITTSAGDTIALTAADGRFLLTNLPAGTHQVEVRKVGYQPAQAFVSLRPQLTEELALSVSAVTELSTVDVKADAFVSRDRLDFEYRKSTGWGQMLEAKDIKGKPDLQSALSPLSNITVRRPVNNVGRNSNFERGDMVIMPTTVTRRDCSGTQVFIDGIQSNVSMATLLAVDDIKAIEWYSRSTSAPAKYYDRRFCALILFWTQNARWGPQK